MNYEVLISFIGASMLLTVMPGPDIIYVLVQSITNGSESVLTVYLFGCFTEVCLYLAVT